MSPKTRLILISVVVAGAVAAVVSFVLSFVGGGVLAHDWMVPTVIGLTIAGAVGRLAGNRNEHRLDATERVETASLTPPAGAALLVVTREGFIAKALGIDVLVDGRRAAQLRSPRAVVFRLAPGPHEVAALDPSAGSKGAPSTPLAVELAPGEVAFVALRVTMAMARNALAVERAADPAQARAAFARMPLVAPDPEWAAAIGAPNAAHV